MNPRRAFEEGERQQKLDRRGRRRQALIGLVAVGITALTVVAVATDKLLRPGAFPIKELRLRGEFDRLDPEQVRQAIIGKLGDNYFSLDLGLIEQAVEDLPWVYQATVKRSWPDGLKVRVEEQQPVARWGEDKWLNDRAQIIELDPGFQGPGMVMLSGPESVAGHVWGKYNEWKPLLATVGLEIEAMAIDERFSWVLSLRMVTSMHQIQVLLGLDDLDQRLRRFVGSFPVLTRESPPLVSVDLRYPNGLAVTRTLVKQEEVALNEVD